MQIFRVLPQDLRTTASPTFDSLTLDDTLHLNNTSDSYDIYMDDDSTNAIIIEKTTEGAVRTDMFSYDHDGTDAMFHRIWAEWDGGSAPMPTNGNQIIFGYNGAQYVIFAYEKGSPSLTDVDIMLYTHGRSAAPQLFLKDTNGYVGIGTNSPSYLCHIAGTCRVNTTLYVGDTTITTISGTLYLSAANYQFGSGESEIVLTFDGSTYNGYIKWEGAVDYFKCYSGWFMQTSAPVYFRTTNEKIYSEGAGYIDIYAGTAIRIHDNTNITGMLRQTAPWHVYGGFEDANGGAGETIDLSSTDWEHVTNAGNDLWTGTEAVGFTLSGDQITVTNTADYIGHVVITITGTATKEYDFQVYNNTQTETVGFKVTVTCQAAGGFQTVSIPLYLEATASDVLEVQAKCDDGNDVTVHDAIFYLAYLHD